MVHGSGMVGKFFPGVFFFFFAVRFGCLVNLCGCGFGLSASQCGFFYFFMCMCVGGYSAC